MNVKTNAWKIIVIFILIITVVAAINLKIRFDFKNNSDLSRIEYRTDIQPLIDRFGETIDIEECFWKADVFSDCVIGPSSYWIKGFIKINDRTFQKLIKQYSFLNQHICFEKGINPEITGYDDFNWAYSKLFSSEIKGAGFIGDVYLDLNNAIVYFDLESN